MKVEWSNKSPQAPGWYWLCDETPQVPRLIYLFEVDGSFYFEGEDADGVMSLRDQEFLYGGWWAPAELPDPPDSVL